MYLIIDEKMRKIEKDTLKKMGYKLIEIKKNNKVYEEISSHVDIFVCKIGEKIIVEKSQFNNIRSIFNVEQGYEEIEEKYPYDIKYNVCIIGKKAIHNLKYTDSKIIEELKKQNYELINTTQGYTNCSIAVIDDNSAIVTDKGLNKILQKHNINTLYIEDELDIKLINKAQYSDKKGFIGGCMARIGENIIVFGDLNKIDSKQKIKDFIYNRNLKIIEFKNLDLIDYGGIVEL